MATTIYGDYVNTGGGYIVRAYLTYTLTESATSATIAWTAGVNIKSGYTTNAKIICKSTATGQSTQSKTVDNTGWGAGSHQMLSGSYTYTRTATATNNKTITINIATGHDSTGKSVSYTYNAKLQSWTVAYNNNGGSGAPASQTKYYNTSLTLSSVVPTWSGHTFKKWNTAANGSGADYNPGATYTANSAATLYAQWEDITYTVSYDANGGSGAPAAQTKVYGQTLTLSDTVPTRKGYKFLGWATSDSATEPTYQPGGEYTINSAVTFYAVWKRSTIIRVKVSGQWYEGTPYVKVSGQWYPATTVNAKVSGEWKES